MYLFDINIYIYAHREDISEHNKYKKYLEELLLSNEACGYSTLALSGFLRIVTHPKIFSPSTDLKTAMDFTKCITDRQNSIPINPGPKHWEIFTELCDKSDAKGNLIPDAFFAALSIESGCVWITTDRDYSRFENLNWKHPFG